MEFIMRKIGKLLSWGGFKNVTVPNGRLKRGGGGRDIERTGGAL